MTPVVVVFLAEATPGVEKESSGFEILRLKPRGRSWRRNCFVIEDCNTKTNGDNFADRDQKTFDHLV